MITLRQSISMGAALVVVAAAWLGVAQADVQPSPAAIYLDGVVAPMDALLDYSSLQQPAGPYCQGDNFVGTILGYGFWVQPDKDEEPEVLLPTFRTIAPSYDETPADACELSGAQVDSQAVTFIDGVSLFDAVMFP